MMPLTFAAVGEENTIVKIGGKPEVKKHLENLGFVVGGTVKVGFCDGRKSDRERKGSESRYQSGDGAENHDLMPSRK